MRCTMQLFTKTFHFRFGEFGKMGARKSSLQVCAVEANYSADLKRASRSQRFCARQTFQRSAGWNVPSLCSHCLILSKKQHEQQQTPPTKNLYDTA